MLYLLIYFGAMVAEAYEYTWIYIGVSAMLIPMVLVRGMNHYKSGEGIDNRSEVIAALVFETLLINVSLDSIAQATGDTYLILKYCALAAVYIRVIFVELISGEVKED